MLNGCTHLEQAHFKPDLIIRGPAGHPMDKVTGARPAAGHHADASTLYDPIRSIGEGADAPPGLPGLMQPSHETLRPEFVIPDAQVMFGRPDK